MDFDFEIGSFPIAVYAAMLGATVAGQFLGMGVDALALGRRVLWVPLAISVLLEALVAARFGAARLGHELTRAQRGRLSVYYSLGLTGVTLPLIGWLLVSHGRSPAMASSDVAQGIVVVVVAFAAVTVARWGLMSLFARRTAS